MTDDKSCFVISPIGEQDSDTRKRADQILKHVIKPAVTECGYAAVRADEIDKPGIITSQVIQHVVTDPLVVADLTERNPNVFYELALRHALRKPLVQLIKKGERIPFDVAGTRTIQVDHHDLDSVESARREIVNQIRALEAAPGEMETPISVSLDLQILRQSEKPEERSLADLVSLVSELRSGIAKLETKIGGPDGEGSLDEITHLLKLLPHRIEDRYSRSIGTLGTRGHGRIHPGMLRDLAFGIPGNNAAVLVLVVASLFRDTMPWVYELGVETYQSVRRGASDSQTSLENFAQTIEYSIHSPLATEISGRSQEMQIIAEIVGPLLSELRNIPIRPRRTR